jgi:hypothetical protein
LVYPVFCEVIFALMVPKSMLAVAKLLVDLNLQDMPKQRDKTKCFPGKSEGPKETRPLSYYAAEAW